MKGIPKLIDENILDAPERFALVMAQEMLDVLKKERLGPRLLNDPRNLEEHGSPHIAKALLLAGDAERLARKPRAENVEVGNILCLNLRDIPLIVPALK